MWAKVGLLWAVGGLFEVGWVGLWWAWWAGRRSPLLSPQRVAFAIVDVEKKKFGLAYDCV